MAGLPGPSWDGPSVAQQTPFWPSYQLLLLDTAASDRGASQTAPSDSHQNSSRWKCSAPWQEGRRQGLGLGSCPHRTHQAPGTGPSLQTRRPEGWMDR